MYFVVSVIKHIHYYIESTIIRAKQLSISFNWLEISLFSFELTVEGFTVNKNKHPDRIFFSIKLPDRVPGKNPKTLFSLFLFKKLQMFFPQNVIYWVYV